MRQWRPAQAAASARCCAKHRGLTTCCRAQHHACKATGALGGGARVQQHLWLVVAAADGACWGEAALDN